MDTQVEIWNSPKVESGDLRRSWRNGLCQMGCSELGKQRSRGWDPPNYPMVICYIAIEMAIYNEFNHETW